MSASKWGIGIVSFAILAVTLSDRLHSIELEVGALETQESALSAADAWIGFGSSETSRANRNAQVEVFIDSITPFLHTVLDGKKAWKVTYTNLILGPDRLRDEAGERVQFTCEAWLDSTSGRFLRAEIFRSSRPDVGYRYPTPEEAERQLGSVRERYHGLPDTVPQVSMFEALELNAPRPYFAKETVVQYLMYSRQGSEPVPAWVITRRGTNPFPLPGMSVYPEHISRNWRIVYNAITGRAFPETNTPFPILDTPEDTLGEH